MEDYEEEEVVKRFGCSECGHSFAMEVEEDMPSPKFCPFCAAPVYDRDVDEEDEFDLDDDSGFHL